MSRIMEQMMKVKGVTNDKPIENVSKKDLMSLKPLRSGTIS